MTPDFIVELRKSVGHAELWLIGVTMVVVRGDHGAEEVLLVRRTDNGRWTPVTGIVDPAEEPDDAGVREVAEETALDAAPVRLLSVQTTRRVEYANGDRARYLDHSFLAEVVGGPQAAAESRPHPADGENTEARWVPVGELPEMAPRFARTVELAIATRRGDSDGAVLFGPEERKR
ncbi:NUDIX domain-containing protein [uncultured Corynebacterium sp.]|uniref:NUDIX hydrolase n=1 Tax=uncultured Corynebacterium sp. TaxID=159447 RepID=UPI0025DE33D2|nr:NUDIX domain-containing protein [uncultured Corynebacterium sp.]